MSREDVLKTYQAFVFLSEENISFSMLILYKYLNKNLDFLEKSLRVQKNELKSFVLDNVRNVIAYNFPRRVSRYSKILETVKKMDISKAVEGNKMSENLATSEVFLKKADEWISKNT